METVKEIRVKYDDLMN